ncbi:unnamed protein product [Paramecium pentaurelia]|uniref:Uncharacterized protein n=1 Tax=Paramecium pentaurelia TaxID=43138 RepID=A0A8S1UPN3_9CILI|nr:unnamed protein product [Paramecium pentaurelia]
MGQSCGCSAKFCEATQITTQSNIEQQPKYNQPETSSPEELSEKKFFTISDEFNQFKSFLEDLLINTQSKKLKQKIYEISWEIQYFIITATNIFSFDLEKWKQFIVSPEKQQIIESFSELISEHNPMCTSEKFIDKLDFEEWIRKTDLQNKYYKQSKIHIHFFGQK